MCRFVKSFFDTPNIRGYGPLLCQNIKNMHKKLYFYFLLRETTISLAEEFKQKWCLWQWGPIGVPDDHNKKNTVKEW